MPQLNLAWWLLNFFLGWTSLLVIFIILLNTSITNNTANTSTTTNTTPNLNWTWN
uniref:ATP synthase protein 8 n=1 Tax=Patiria pectinifera TaxID=7594 RepID=ATP8_PATPE|nr:ATP synthase F0 subunit 8 [Patiria pectinifera]Q33822.1 RecName: Full=ATP synthase protein 8; AltName: Full=A6L; AltName: Full=F-ATPase subunit 8 [Patiria pectinifera]BAA03883.1 ATPase 8 [Patiria pectinifera]